VLVTWQKVALVVALVLVVLAAVADLRAVVVTLSVVVGLAFLVGTGFKFWASLRGARMEHVTRTDAATLAALPDHELPRYTVLVPVYKEANIVANLIGNLGALDYPAHLLEVLILVEEDDTETRAAAEAAHPPAHFRFITVPAGAPQTKPKACNVGLEFATGEYLVIYDAEDKPEPDQLKKAVLAFRQAGEELVCVQAALNYFNADENPLTRMFTLEYSFWFDYMLPGLEYGRLAIPLGGTSNHFRVSGLRRLGGWDPYNVTEDADLGIRASAEGMRVGVIDSTTYEEANTSYPNFVRQRSRWIKGYMQTTLVHLRQPFRLVKVAGLRQTLSFLFLVGGTPATFLAVPLLYAVFLASLLLDPDQLSFLFPGWVLWLSLFNLGVGSALMIYVSMMGAFKRRRYGLVLWGLANPAYWLLHSVAAYKALWQLVTKPHYWEKTAHGLTGVTAAAHVPAAVRG
jgi:cellulose synthase/poly-beta-1,6-N-acetylglucosamine synthase-like glycosyltransferase